MAKFRMIQTDFWSDPKIVEEFTPEDKFFFLYLLTNPKTTQIGIYVITKKHISFDTGYTIEAVNAIMDRFINHHEVISYNTETRELAIKNWGRYNLNKGGKPIEDCVRSELKEVKDISLINYVGERIQKKEIKALYDSYNVSSHDTDNDTSSEPSHDTHNDSKRSENEEASHINTSDDTSDDSSTISGQDKEEEEEKEEYKEKQQQQELDKTLDSGGSGVDDPGFKEILDFYRDNLQKAITETPFNYELLGKFYDEWGKDLMLAALKLAAKKEAKGISFIEAVFNNWRTYGVKTLEDARRYNERMLKSRKGYSNHKVEDVPSWYREQKEKNEEIEKQATESPQSQEEQADVSQLLKQYNSKKSPKSKTS
ncbi:DnaD domain protein [Paraliobacillus salinarum]|uniref:DnaD domain protein n=1 Tax=Paraliobacillus salinarum TaxID=1158996 RepID=UPI0015F6428C|nr:DnaD domain protein [Paraliobacillus salinarum]